MLLLLCVLAVLLKLQKESFEYEMKNKTEY